MIRLVGAIHDEWQVGDHRYFSEGSIAKLYPELDTASIAEVSSGE